MATLSYISHVMATLMATLHGYISKVRKKDKIRVGKSKDRNSRPEAFCKKRAVENLTKFT